MYKTNHAKTNSMSRVLSAALSVALLLTMLVTFGLTVPTVNAAGEIGIQAGVPSTLAVGSKVYYGTYPQTQLGKVVDSATDTVVEGLVEGVDYAIYPNKADGNANYYYALEGIAWRVLQNTDGKLFLLSENALEYHAYNTHYTSVTWETSTMRKWLNGDTGIYNDGGGFLSRAFSAEEQVAILTTTVQNSANPSYPDVPSGNATDDKIFLLSIQEATNTAYGFTGDNSSTLTRQAPTTAYAWNTGTTLNANPGFWWLRSLGIGDKEAASVSSTGIVYADGYYVTYSHAVRPAFNLDLSSVILTSSAVGGKSSLTAADGLVGADAIATDASVKFTVKDSSLILASVTHTGIAGNTVSFAYTGASVGKTLSAVVLDDSGAVKYYGKLIDSIATADGTASVTVPNGLEATDTVQIFVEECNGNYLTDFASGYKELDIEHDESGPAATCTTDKVCVTCNAILDPKTGHTPGDWIIDTPATATTDGSKHKECTVCGYVTETEAIKGDIDYYIIQGAGSTDSSWKKGTAAGAMITCNGDFVKFTGVKVNGVLVDESNYTKRSGSTIIIFKPEYLETLTVGVHTVELMFTDGSAQTDLVISAAGVIAETDPFPSTGDNSNMMLWILLGGGSALGMIVAGRRRKRFHLKTK